MHLHWKYRELVKLITKQKTLAYVEDTARLLEYESGGILIAIERVPKGFALIFYRGKNYRRPISLRPRNLLTKAKALKRSVAMQRHEVFLFTFSFLLYKMAIAIYQRFSFHCNRTWTVQALSQHISDLENTIEQMKKEIVSIGFSASFSIMNSNCILHKSRHTIFKFTRSIYLKLY